MKSIQIVVLLLLLCSRLVSAQSHEREGRFFLSASGGIAVNQPADYVLYWGPRVLVNLGFSASVSAGYGPVWQVSGTEVHVLVDFAVSQTQTSDVQVSDSRAYAKWTRVPIIAWARITTNNVVSPFVEVGLGAMKVSFQETYDPSFDNLKLDYWAFAWGAGAGIRWASSNSIRWSLFLDVSSGEGTRTTLRRNGRPGGLYLRSMITAIGIRGEFEL